MIIFVTTLLLVVALLNLVQGQAQHVRRLDKTELTCLEGYVLDKYCINQNSFEDDPDAIPLLVPETHSFICMLNPDYCRNSGFEILGDPAADGDGVYKRVASLDDTGNQMIIELGYRIGSGCKGCNGTVSNGLRALVVGSFVGGDVSPQDTSTAPPILMVKGVAAASETTCETLMAEVVGKGETNAGAGQTTSEASAWGSPLLLLVSFTAAIFIF